MNGKVAKIIRYAEKGKTGEQLDEARLITGLGLDGNIKQGGEKQLCLLSVQARGWMDNQAEKGLCFDRFKENILVDGLPLEELRNGDRLAIGEAVLRVSAYNKKCFDECELFKKGKPCRLSSGAVFAVVERGGIIRAGDSIILNTNKKEEKK